MTHSLPEFSSQQNSNTIQCRLCLHDIDLDSVQNETDGNKKVDWVVCQTCNYHQPLRKVPGIRDLLIFGGIIGTVYFLTIFAILVSR